MKEIKDFDEVCVHRLFERLVALTPDAIAVVDQNQVLSYRQLNASANQLAHYLRQRGVRTESLVGLCVKRSVDFVTGMLACLKAGAAFVPLDPEQPAHRLGLVFQDTNMTTLLSQSTLAERLPEGTTGVVWMDQVWEECRDLSAENLTVAIAPRNLAYVIYTSGSTGTPKGVAIEHAGLANLVQWHLQEYQLSAADRATQVASPGFDAAVWEVWPYLCAGASLYIVDDETRASVRKLKEYLLTHGIRMSFLPTPLAEVMLEEWEEDEVVELRGVLTGGDKLRRRPRAGAGYRLYNHYGPTENTVVATGGEVLASEPGTEPTIGQPISNVQTYVLDEHLNAVPVGVKGELFLGGTSLARGYLNDPAKTALSFIANPFSKDSGGRMYKTGDVVRSDPAGELEFVGREDNQVKVRGYRIELGEIEAVLLQPDAVQTGVVDFKQSETGERILVGYVVPKPSLEIDEEELREYLRKRLPEYMVPARFVSMEKLTLTINGKIDRQALPLPTKTAERTTSFVAPRNNVEKKLADAWAATLGLERVGIYDNFFEIGGDSIRSIQVITTAKEAGLRLTAKQLFQQPTIARLSELVEIVDAAGCGESH
jgi:amino acid adenylation domain-containing protein